MNDNNMKRNKKEEEKSESGSTCAKMRNARQHHLTGCTLHLPLSFALKSWEAGIDSNTNNAN